MHIVRRPLVTRRDRNTLTPTGMQATSAQVKKQLMGTDNDEAIHDKTIMQLPSLMLTECRHSSVLLQ